MSSHLPVNNGPTPSPNGSVIALLCALSNPSDDISRHQEALTARDQALSSSPESYSNLCLQFCYVMSCPSLQQVLPTEMEAFKQMDPPSYMQLNHEPSLWNSQFRIMAGLLLKNSLVRPPIFQNQGSRMKLTKAASEEIKSLLLKCIIDDNNQGVRNAASSCVAVCSVPLANTSLSHAAFPLEEWPQLIPFLLSCCSNVSEQIPATSVALGALSTLKKLLEDNTDCPILLQSEHIVPTLLQILQTPLYNDPNQNPQMLQLSLQCLHTLIEPLPTTLVLHMTNYLQILSNLSTHPSYIIQALVCKTISTLLATRTEYLQPHITSIVDFILSSMSSPIESVTLEATEFWLQYATMEEEAFTPLMQTTLTDIYPRLVPVLLENMIYPEDKIQDILIENEEFLQQQESNQTRNNNNNQAPIFHRSKAASRSSNTTSKTFPSGDNIDSDDDDFDDNDSDGANPNVDDDDDESSWTVRKCSAATLDSLSGLLPPSITLPPLLPLLQSGLSPDTENDNEKKPWVREASILALGAIATGCQDEMAQNYLPQLHPYLIQQIQNEPLPQIRCIGCWTLSRYADWTLLNTEVFKQTCGSILNLVSSDNDPKVRYAACSAFGVFVEASCNIIDSSVDYENGSGEAENALIPILQPIYEHLIRSLEKSTLQNDSKGVMILFDTIGVMADYVGAPIGNYDLPSIYIPPLLHIWDLAASSGNILEKNLLPLMEAMGSIALVIGQNIQPWALRIFEKCMQTIEACVLAQAVSLEDQAGFEGDEEYDPMICATDCLDGMVEGLTASFTSLVQSSQKYGHHFLGVLHSLTKHDSPGVRMSSFALLGDLARRSPNILQDGVSGLIKEAVHSCDLTQYPSLCNNATWAMGEICVQCIGHRTLINGVAEEMAEKLGRLLMAERYGDGDGIPGLSENAAASLGRLARVDASLVGRNLERCFVGWCDGLASIADPRERCDGFTGLILAIQSNPAAIVSPPNPIDPNKLSSLIFAVVSWHIPPNEEGVPTFTSDMANGVYTFEPFPDEYQELGWKLGELLQSIKSSVSAEDWKRVDGMPLNLRRLLTEMYQV